MKCERCDGRGWFTASERNTHRWVDVICGDCSGGEMTDEAIERYRAIAAATESW